MIIYDFRNNSFKASDKNGILWEYKRIGVTEDEVKALIKDIGRKDAITKLTAEGKIKPIYGGKIEY